MVKSSNKVIESRRRQKRNIRKDEPVTEHIQETIVSGDVRVVDYKQDDNGVNILVEIPVKDEDGKNKQAWLDTWKEKKEGEWNPQDDSVLWDYNGLAPNDPDFDSYSEDIDSCVDQVMYKLGIYA